MLDNSAIIRGGGLDNEQILRQFEEIEQKVENVIGICKSYQATNLELLNKIDKLEEELQNKIEAVNRYNKEKALIRSKINNLLVKLEDITEVKSVRP
jgi:predicted nuclease with TOPRIM domain